MDERLDFTIPDFLRVVWVSEIAREYWEPKIHTISALWSTIERASITNGLRGGALQSIHPEELPEAQNWAMRNDIGISIVGMDGAIDSYGNASISYIPGRPFTYRVYFGANPKDVHDDWKFGDNIGIGAALGFPECCVNFFDKFWRAEGWRDLTYPAMVAKEVRNLIYNNVLLRHIGIRSVFHLPCSFLCKDSCKIGMDIQDLMGAVGNKKEADWLKELVSMPMEWTSLHGVAIVTTPIFKMIYATDALPKKVVLHLLSEYYPDHGASGKSFPFLNTRPVRLHLQSKKERFNGFNTLEGMREGHDFILSSLPPDITGTVLDLGCGTGELLKTILNAYPDAAGQGIDTDEEALTKIPYQPLQLTRFDLSDIYLFDWEVDYDLVLIAIQRLFEVDRGKVQELLDNIAWHTKKLLIYSYDGWFNGLDDLLGARFQVISTNRNAIMNFEAKLFERKTEELPKL
jgi:Trans-aconitate methyltransferase